ncbi:MAG TPA: DUF1688 family protein [Candidatus Binatia bacterium]|nr:DUF1688 family protein [Candidatus Binatia bacterium]
MGEEAGTAVALLRLPGAIRERCHNVLEAGLAGRLDHFGVALSRLPAAAEFVADVTRRRYPSLDIPCHSRWRHLDAGGVRRGDAFRAAISALPADERARAKIDLIVTSVLLDAGAGDAWRFREVQTGQTFTRSEGLAVASFRMFEAGLFSSEPSDPWRADARALAALDEGRLATGLQVSADNPLIGLGGRLGLLQALGRTLKGARVGDLFDALRCRASHGQLEAQSILEQVLVTLAGIWPRRLGDTWPHPAAGGHGPSAGLVPLHKLSQWLTYSLVEPLEEAGLAVAGLDRLTGLAEYRNGGLFIDLAVVVPRHPDVRAITHPPESEVVVEWRALTVALLDRLAPLVAECLGLRPAQLPLIRLLEGGTWAAGRELAAARRAGAPPIRVATDGTVF